MKPINIDFLMHRLKWIMLKEKYPSVAIHYQLPWLVQNCAVHLKKPGAFNSYMTCYTSLLHIIIASIFAVKTTFFAL